MYQLRHIWRRIWNLGWLKYVKNWRDFRNKLVRSCKKIKAIYKIYKSSERVGS
jgi:hypothetical protein